MNKIAIEHTVAERVRSARKHAGISVTDFCHMAAISRTYLYRIESGDANISLKVLVRIASCLDLEPVDLIR